MVTKPKQQLSLYDSICIIVGIIIGAGIFQMAPDAAKGAFNAWGVLALWTIGGLLSMAGALCYAELASTYPKEGGDFVYLSQAYGPWAGFLFGWVQLTIIRPGDIAVMAFAFAMYGRALYDPLPGHPELSRRIYAALAVTFLTIVNLHGVKQGKWTQNLLTTIKFLGVLAIVAAALFSPPAKITVEKIGSIPTALALIFVLFTYGGWNEMAYVAAEVKNPRKTIARGLILGITVVMILYLLVNLAFLHTLGYGGLSNSKAVAVDSIAVLFPNAGQNLIAALICISALGAINGLIFTGARISYAMGSRYKTFGFLGTWNHRQDTPLWALLIQGMLAFLLIIIFGSFVDTILYSACAVYTFYLGTTLSVIVLRVKEPAMDRPYRVIGYPITPLVFAGVCGYLIFSTIQHALDTRPVSLWIQAGFLLTGICLYRRIKNRQQNNRFCCLSDS